MRKNSILLILALAMGVVIAGCQPAEDTTGVSPKPTTPPPTAEENQKNLANSNLSPEVKKVLGAGSSQNTK